MNVSVENLGPCKKLLRVEVPPDQVDVAFDEVIGLYQRQAQLPGFRAGKAPKHLVVKNFEGKIKEEVRRKLFEDSYRKASQDQNLRVIATFGVEEQSFGRGLPFGYTVTLEHAPEFQTPNYKGLTARREVAVAGDVEVERAINILREQHVKYNDVQRAVQSGDVAVVNYTGTCEGRPLTDFNPTAKGLTEKQGMWMLVQENSFIPGFTEQLVGANVGDKRSVKVTFPADFVIKEVATKEGVFEVEVTGVKEKVLPEVNDAFAQEFGAANVDELKQGVQRDLQNELNFRVKRNVRDQLLKHLLGQVTFDLPESVVSSETRQLVYNIVNENQQRGVAKEVIEARKNEIFQSAQTSALDRVKAAFILNRIAETEKITITEKEVTQRVLAMAEQNNLTPEKMVKTLQERNAFPEIQQDILTGKVLDWLELNAQIEEVPAGSTAAAPAPAEAPAA
ncbi:MAG: trigger factor [Verrucomicrobia bacterium]|nr:trigger factor [Verrucomicrobiota bacterium]